MASFVLKTWNCFGAAQSALAFLRWRGAPDTHRFELPEVQQAVGAADIVCMQEVFLSDAESFFDRLAFGHKTRVANRSTLFPLTFGGSGLAIASRFPIEQETIRSFSRPQLGTERFARKGMLHARLELDSVTRMDVVTTHLQSGYGSAAARVRDRQLCELGELVAELGASHRAFVVCGDLNICGLSRSRAEGEYAALRERFLGFADLGADGDRPTFHPHPEVNALAHRYESKSPEQRIDYVLFRPSDRDEVRPTQCEVALEKPFFPAGRGRTFASDHFALKATFTAPGAGAFSQVKE